MSNNNCGGGNRPCGGSNPGQFPDFSQLFGNINFQQLQDQMAPVAVAISEALQNVAAQAQQPRAPQPNSAAPSEQPPTEQNQNQQQPPHQHPLDQFLNNFNLNMEQVESQFAPVAVALSEAMQNVSAQTRSAYASATAPAPQPNSTTPQEKPTATPQSEKPTPEAQTTPTQPNQPQTQTTPSNNPIGDFFRDIDTEQIEAQMAPIAVAISEAVQSIASQVRDGVQSLQDQIPTVQVVPSREVKVENDEKKFAVTFNVSEYRPESLNVYVNDRTLVIEGHQETRDEHGGRHIQNFGRSWDLPETANADDVRSHLTEDGTLTITAPKITPQSSTTKNIPINVVKK